MLGTKEMLSALAVALGLIAYIPYLRNVLNGNTKPHAFSWLIWFLGTGTAFAAQVVSGAGVGSWALGATTTCCFVIFCLSLIRGHREITKGDCIALAGSLTALLLWWLTKDPTLSVILISIMDAAAFYPTFRKSYRYPHQETLSLYLIDAIHFVPAIMALEVYALTTWLYPSVILTTDLLLVMFLFFRRRKMKLL